MLRHIGSTRNKTGRSILYAASVAAVATLAVSLSEAGPAKADFGTSEDPIVVSPLTWNPTYMPITPFKATDGLYHLQYQLLVMDVFSSPATVADGDVLDAEDGCLRVYGVGDDGVPAFTDSGIECLKQIIADKRAAGTAPPKVQSTK
jgi:hypothetical protein